MRTHTVHTLAIKLGVLTLHETTHSLRHGPKAVSPCRQQSRAPDSRGKYIGIHRYNGGEGRKNLEELTFFSAHQPPPPSVASHDFCRAVGP